MSNNLRRPPGLSADLMSDLLSNLSFTALAAAKEASEYDVRAAFENNMPTMMVANQPANQAVSANDSNYKMELIKQDMVESGRDMVAASTDEPDQARFAKAKAGFKDNTMTVVHKSDRMITYTTDPNSNVVTLQIKRNKAFNYVA